MFSDYPNIADNIFMFNIDVVDGDADELIADERIGHTIFRVFKIFFETRENVAVYVCDTLDERHLARKRKFDIWFWKFNDWPISKERIQFNRFNLRILQPGSRSISAILLRPGAKNLVFYTPDLMPRSIWNRGKFGLNL